jgi:hypothetical protein
MRTGLLLRRLSISDSGTFALGSVLYHIMTGRYPYHDIFDAGNEDEIKTLIKKGDFQETGSLRPVGAIITKCWRAVYHSAADIRKDIGYKYYSPSIASHASSWLRRRANRIRCPCIPFAEGAPSPKFNPDVSNFLDPAVSYLLLVITCLGFSVHFSNVTLYST